MSCPFEVLFNPEFAEKKVNISLIKAENVFERGEKDVNISVHMESYIDVHPYDSSYRRFCAVPLFFTKNN